MVPGGCRGCRFKSGFGATAGKDRKQSQGRSGARRPRRAGQVGVASQRWQLRSAAASHQQRAVAVVDDCGGRQGGQGREGEPMAAEWLGECEARRLLKQALTRQPGSSCTQQQQSRPPPPHPPSSMSSSSTSPVAYCTLRHREQEGQAGRQVVRQAGMRWGRRRAAGGLGLPASAEQRGGGTTQQQRAGLTRPCACPCRWR